MNIRNFEIEDREPDPPKHICTACKKRCKFTEAYRGFCLHECRNVRTERIAGKTKKGRA